METISTLNVTVMEPRFKHPAVFNQFDSLKPGQAFILMNDHDPKPLYYQLLAERGEIFSWEYLLRGPEAWEIKISRNELPAQEETIGDLVTRDYRTAQVFKRFGIDFCCGGKRTITEACAKKSIDEQELKLALEQVTAISKDHEHNYLKWDIGFLSDYIVNTHHQYVKENLPFITELANKVARVHGDSYPGLIIIADIFDKVAADLTMHLSKEETTLFPIIKELDRIQKSGIKLPEGSTFNVDKMIGIMEKEHEDAGEALNTIRELSNNFELPADACGSFTILYKKLDEFENDLHKHVHLENNILFPKAIQAEKELQHTH